MTLSLLIIFSACGVSGDCTADDWVGTYSAEAICIMKGEFVDTTVMVPLDEVAVIKIDDQTIVFDDGDIINREITIQGCQILEDTSLSISGEMTFDVITYRLIGDQIFGRTNVDAEDFFSSADSNLYVACDVVLLRLE